MGPYIIQVICFQALFLAVYYVVLRKETFFVYNRIYLLITPVLSFVIPFIKIVTLQTVVPAEMIAMMLPEITVGNSPVQEAAVTSEFRVPWGVIYIGGLLVSTLIFIIKLRKFATYLSFKKDGTKIIQLPASREAFTFFNYIFIGEEINLLSRKQILTHEKIHAKQGHTWDLIFFELLKIVLWFNPLVYIYQNYISIIHEYLADQKATTGISKKAYYEELLNTAFGTSNLSFTNTFFNKSFIKNRIIMLQKSKSKKSALAKYTLIVPLVLIMLLQVSWTKGGDSLEPETLIDVPFEIVEKVPIFPGCESLSSNDERKTCMSDKVAVFVNRNFDVQIAKPLGLTGVKNRVFVAFRVNKNGQIDNVKARAPHPQLKEEAMRVINSLPQMKPGEHKGEPVGVLYSLPITFQVN